MKTTRIFLFALLGCTSFVFSQSYSGVLTHTNGYFTMEPFNSSYDDGSTARLFYDGNNKRIRFWNTDSGTSYTHINVGNIEANGNLAATGNITASGSLGIGVTSPTAKLHFKDGNQEIRLLTGSNSSTYRLDVGVNDDGINFENNSAVRGFVFSNINGNLFNISSNGNVGIGTTTPSAKLEVLKDADLSSAITIPNSGLILRADNDGNDASLRLGVDNSNLKAVVQTQQTTTGTKFDLLINPFGGNVGIGTTNTGTYKLAVNGNVRAKEIKVETGWSDFVFEKNYQLPTLEEVEAHIKDKGHLKDIPSAEEVAENGILLGEMDSKLLQKIEELTLYIIAINKKVEQLEKENAELRKER